MCSSDLGHFEDFIFTKLTRFPRKARDVGDFRDDAPHHLLVLARQRHKKPAGRFTIVSLVWDAGQFSPVHGHYTWCAYMVRTGELLENAYRVDPASGRATVTATRGRRGGDGCFSFAGLDQVHKLGNNTDRPAVSIHVYGLDGARVSTHVNRIVDKVSQEGTTQ